MTSPMKVVGLSDLIKAYPKHFALEERGTSNTGGKALYVKNTKGK